MGTRTDNNISTISWSNNPRKFPQARLRLFCFPYAGGGTSVFRGWAEALPATVDVWLAQLPGRESRMIEMPFRQLSPLVDDLAAACYPHLDIPFAFFGHSMGAIIGFELARRLRAYCNIIPSHLFVSGCIAPHQHQARSRTIHQLPTAEFIEELHRLNGTHKEILQNQELMALLLPTLRADFELIETYTYVPNDTLRCPITAFGGLEDEHISKERLAAWSEYSQSSFRLHMLSGDHFFINTQRTLLLRILSDSLAKMTGEQLWR